MPAFNPTPDINPASPIHFLYTKNVIPPASPITVIATFQQQISEQSWVYPWKVEYLPNWLESYDLIVNTANKTVSFVLRPTSAADQLPVGDYTARITLSKSTPDYSGLGLTNPDFVEIFINLTVAESNQLSVNPGNLIYNYQLGAPAPSTQLLAINTDQNWSIAANQSWVTFDSQNGSGNSNINVGVSAGSLAIGTYQSIITVTDSYTSVEVLLTLNVTDTSGNASFINTNPNILNFISQFGVPNTTAISVLIDASDSWTLTTNNSIVNTDITNGSSGQTQLDVSVNSDSLAVGTHNEIITLDNGNGVSSQITIIITVLEAQNIGVTSGGFYYADDRNKITFSSTQQGVYLITEIQSYFNQMMNFILKTPFFVGIANQVIGLEANYLIKRPFPTDSFISRVTNPINPMLMSAILKLKNSSTNVETQITSIVDTKWLTGKTPIRENVLSYLPENIITSKDAVLSLATVSQFQAITDIVITGSVNTTLTSSLPNNKHVYNAILNLADLPLEIGDKIMVNFGLQTVNITIDDTQFNTTKIAFLNEWYIYEYITLDGVIKINDTSKTNTTKILEDGQIHEVVYDITEGKEFIINTGKIRTQQEVEWISKIMKSKKIFIYLENTPIEVILQTKKINIQQERKYFYSFDLKFKKAKI